MATVLGANARLVTSRQNRLLEWFLRSFAIATYVLMLLVIFNNWRVTSHAYSLLMLLLTEGFTLGIVVFARGASRRDVSPLLVLAVIYTSSFFLLLETSDTLRLIPEWAAATVQAVGLGMTVIAKATLGRAFGILPAVRGLVTGGPYMLVRHPIYLGYLIGNVGFLLANGSIRNLLVIAALLLVQVLRILREEEVLRNSEFSTAFKAYCARVRFRLVPYVF